MATHDRLNEQIAEVAAGPSGEGGTSSSGSRRRRQPAPQQAVAQSHRTRKNPLVANVAIARELARSCWSLATMY
jgi:hypothetical protein